MSTLRKGDSGPEVVNLQSAINKAGHGPIKADGAFGPATEKAVKSVQTSCGLVVDGIAGPKTQAALGMQEESFWTPYVRSAWNRYKDIIVDECYDMELEEATALAVIAVESAGVGLIDGLPVIRFENHLFKKYIAGDLFLQHFSYNPDQRWKDHKIRVNPADPWKTVHTGDQDDEYDALTLAATFNDEGAYKSISVGAAQILGSWHKRLCYQTAKAMFEANKNEDQQIRDLFKFIRTGSDQHANPDGGLWKSAKERDWYTFAYQYNGPGKPDHYKAQLADAYNAALAIL